MKQISIIAAALASFTTTGLAVKLAFISALVFEISQLQSAQDQVVLARNNAIIVRGVHYELVAMRDPGPQKSRRSIGAIPVCTENWILQYW